MMSVIKKFAVILICSVMLLTAASCGSSTSDADATETTYGVTSDWEYYSVTVNGKTTYKQPLIPDSDNPHFSSEDGTTFKFNVVPDKVYTGDLILNDDGSYTMTKSYSTDSTARLNLRIEGDTLTITINSGNTVVFKAK